jgi:O-antigen ligase
MPDVEENEHAALRWAAWILGAGAVIIPLTISPRGEDAFRLPKTLMFRAEAGVLLILVALAWGFAGLRFDRSLWRERWLKLAAAIAAWTLIAFAFSTNHLVSIAPAVQTILWAFVFMLTVIAARRRGFDYAMLLIPAALINALIYALQELDRFTWFTIPDAPEVHLRRSGLIGNPNDVGSYFVAPALVALALAFADRRRRLIWWPVAAALVAATFATHTATAIGALIAGVLTLAAVQLRDWKKIAAAAVAIAACVAIVFFTYAPLRFRARQIRESFAQRDFNELSSYRVEPFLAALQMAAHHPLTGVGPGAFGYNYYDYKLAIERAHPSLFQLHGMQYNYTQVHDDHLQVLAESGVPGYLLFLAAIVLIGSLSFRRPADNPDPRFAYVTLLALPLAVSFAVLALAQFPLQLAAPKLAFLWAAAPLFAWSERR